MTILRQLSYNWFAGYSGTGKTTWEPFIQGTFTFVSDQRNWTGQFPSGAYHEPLPFPPDFPVTAYINRVRITADGDRTLGAAGEIQIWVDPLGTSFKTANPKGSESGPDDFSHIITLRHLYFYGAPVDDQIELQYPVLLNRAAGDLLTVEISPGQSYSWLNVEFGYLVSDPGP